MRDPGAARRRPSARSPSPGEGSSTLGEAPPELTRVRVEWGGEVTQCPSADVGYDSFEDFLRGTGRMRSLRQGFFLLLKKHLMLTPWCTIPVSSRTLQGLLVRREKSYTFPEWFIVVDFTEMQQYKQHRFCTLKKVKHQAHYSLLALHAEVCSGNSLYPLE